MDAQADLRLCCSHMAKTGFLMKWLTCLISFFYCADALHAYHQVNNSLPRLIMVYRDGVGDGQLEAVGEHEVPQIERACQLVGGHDYK